MSKKHALLRCSVTLVIIVATTLAVTGQVKQELTKERQKNLPILSRSFNNFSTHTPLQAIPASSV